MNSIIFFAFLVADTSALIAPETYSKSIDTVEKRLATNAISNTIHAMSQNIKNAGYDPLHVGRKSFEVALPVPVLFNFITFFEDFSSTGLSNITINKITYSVISSRVNFDIELPHIGFSVGSVSAVLSSFNSTFKMKAAGKIDIKNIRIVGQVRVNVGISGVNIRSIKITFTLGDIIPDIKLVLHHKDLSTEANCFLGIKIPKALKTFHTEVNELLEIVLLDLLKDNL